MAIELVTGHAGEGHVSSADAGRYNAGVCGVGKYVLNTGQKFAYSIESANLIRIASGDAINQGRHITIPQNTYEDANILNGTQGKTRIDVITLRYSKVTRQVDSQTVTVEVATVEVIKGTEVPVGTAPEVPAVISGNIFDGATTDDMPLYHVLITDTSVTSVTAVFTVLDPLDAMWAVIDEYDSSIGGLANKIGDVAMGTTAGTVTGAINELHDKVDADIPDLISDSISNALNSALRWKIFGGGYVPGQTFVTVPAAAKEVYVIVYIKWTSSEKAMVDFHIIIDPYTFGSPTNFAQHVKFYGTNHDGYVCIEARTNGGTNFMRLYEARNGNTDVTAGAYCAYFYR